MEEQDQADKQVPEQSESNEEESSSSAVQDEDEDDDDEEFMEETSSNSNSSSSEEEEYTVDDYNRVLPFPQFLNHVKVDATEEEILEVVKRIKEAKRNEDEDVTLNLAHKNMTKGMRQIVEALKQNSVISEVNCTGNKFTTEESLLQLAEIIECNANIKSLNLTKTYLKLDGMKILTSALVHNNTLEVLDLRENRLDSESVRLLCDSLQSNTTLKVLSLRATSINLVGLQYIRDLLKVNTSIKKLSLQSNLIQEEGAMIISEGLALNKSLENIVIIDNPINSNGVKYICESLKYHPTIKCLELDSYDWMTLQRPSPLELIYVSDLVKCSSSLIRLVLTHFLFTASNSRDFADAIKKNSSIKKIVFESCDFEEDSLKFIAEGLSKNVGVKDLKIEYSEFGDEGAKHLSTVIAANSAMTDISLSDCGIGDVGCGYLCDSLKKNSTIQSIYLESLDETGEDYSLSDKGAQMLLEAAASHPSLSFIDAVPIHLDLLPPRKDVLYTRYLAHKELITIQSFPLQFEEFKQKTPLVDHLFILWVLSQTPLTLDAIDHVLDGFIWYLLPNEHPVQHFTFGNYLLQSKSCLNYFDRPFIFPLRKRRKTIGLKELNLMHSEDKRLRDDL